MPTQYCSSVKDAYKPLEPFLYADLDSAPYRKLEPCTTCQPVKRKSLIAKENLRRGAITEEEYLASLTPIAYPDDSLQQYYNPDGGKYYHSTANCSSVKQRFLPLTAFSYGELDTEPFSGLEPCPYCEPAKRKAELTETSPWACPWEKSRTPPRLKLPLRKPNKQEETLMRNIRRAAALLLILSLAMPFTGLAAR